MREDIRNIAIHKVYPRSPIVDIFRPTTFLAVFSHAPILPPI